VNEKSTQTAPHPGIHTVTDGTGAAVWVEKHGSQGACAYPITPSTNMGVEYAAAAGDGFQNLWGEPLVFLEPESEHSSASAAEGFAAAGGRVTNFTSGQGLVLMKEVLFTISGKRLPAVFHVGSRALTSHSLNVHAGHDDVMAVADTGWGILFAANAQEVADLALIARRAAENSHTPFMCCQDGFLTTHTLETVRLPEPAFMKEFLGDPKERVPCLMDPHHPVMSGVVQNQDSYMKGKVAQRFFTDRVLGFVREAMKTYGAATGRRLSPVRSYRMENAEVAILTMGSMGETLKATVDWATQNTDLRVGAVQLICLRPFPAADLVRALSGVPAIAVIGRMDDPLAGSNLLVAEVKAAFADALSGRLGMPRLSRMPRIHSGIAGLGSRDVRPGHFIAAAKNLYERGKRDFVLGVEHEIALPLQLDPDVRPPGAFSMRGYSVGGFGSVATNKIIATVTANLFDLHVQAFPFYGSEKKGLPTRYFLTAAEQPIRKHCELLHVEFVPLSALASFNLGNPLEGIAKGGTVFVQTSLTDPEEVWRRVPFHARRQIRDLDLRLLYADAAGIAAEVATREDLRVRMQGIVLLGVFLRAAPFVAERGVSRDALMDGVRESLTRYFGKAGERVVEENLVCVQRGYDEVREVPRSVIQEEETEGRSAIAGIRVADLMTEGAVTCRPDTPLAEVHDLLSEKQISCVVVVDEEGEMVGLLSTTDLARAQSLAGRMDHSLPDLRAEHLMTPDVLTTRPEEPLAEAVERLVDNRVHRLVVTSEKEPTRPIGILSLTDLAAAGPMVESR
jgi:pyruvate-ferredoxin/flavodoxin oxidoreductase